MKIDTLLTNDENVACKQTHLPLKTNRKQIYLFTCIVYYIIMTKMLSTHQIHDSFIIIFCLFILLFNYTENKSYSSYETIIMRDATNFIH